MRMFSAVAVATMLLGGVAASILLGQNYKDLPGAVPHG